jgi:hypothetical protein
VAQLLDLPVEAANPPAGSESRALRVIAISGVAALVAAVLSVCTVSLLPPRLEPRQLTIAGAATQIMIDTPRSAIVDPDAKPTDFQSLTYRADLLAGVMVSRSVLEQIASRAGVSADEIAAIRRPSKNVPLALIEPGSEKRAYDILRSDDRYRLEIQARGVRPIVEIYAQAPSPGAAKRLADAAVQGLRDHLRELATSQGFELDDQLKLHQLGPARGGVINGGTAPKIALLTFLVVFGICCGALLLLARIRSMWRERPAPTVDDVVSQLDDWPRTTRVLPWMLAGMFVVVWLVPFNAIELSASLPIDLKFDRLIMPFVILVWVLALVSGGPGAPRLRLTPIHVAVGVFAAVACLSVVFNAHDLNEALELDTSIKKLPLLVAYLSLFFVAASVVRPTEVPAFLMLTLVLAVIAALGLVWEYRFEYNVFYDWSDKLLPGIFQVAVPDSSSIDAIGRRMTIGPAELGLEAVAMLAMALPVALVGITQARRWGVRLLYGLAAAVLLAAAFSTYRKSALLAPVSVVLTLAYFRRRELLKMAPLGVVVLVVVHFLSPGALGSTTVQLESDRLGATTVSDRTADYDAVRPDLWTHLLFGRGWGSYEHTSYRILDNELLHQALELGLIGLAAFVFLGVAVVASARGMIRARHRVWSPIALACAAAAVAFVVVSTLFDSLSFPHVPYIFMTLAGLLAATLRRGGEEAR